MQVFKIKGGKSLNGTLPISGAKNAVLPIMCATLLTAEPVILHNVPFCSDVYTLMALLKDLGAEIKVDESHHTMILQTPVVKKTLAAYEFVSKMRASFWVLGALMGRCHEAHVSFPGGCSIGARPVDLYLMALEKMGAEVEVANGYVNATGTLKNADIVFAKKSVGATHNTIMAAVLTPGETRIFNPALEPEVGDLIHILQKMGAKITGEGTDTLVIQGVKALKGAEHTIIPDRIETGSYMLATALTKGRVFLQGATLEHLKAFYRPLMAQGLYLEQTKTGVLVEGENFTPKGLPITTTEYPGFPTDLQSVIAPMLCVAEGESVVVENIFENRFMHVPELQRMGANITVLDAHSILIKGGAQLTGAAVKASDLRNGFALVLAGLIAKGETTVANVQYPDRGYVNLEEKLSGVGADIRRIDVFESGEVNQS